MAETMLGLQGCSKPKQKLAEMLRWIPSVFEDPKEQSLRWLITKV